MTSSHDFEGKTEAGVCTSTSLDDAVEPYDCCDAEIACAIKTFCARLESKHSCNSVKDSVWKLASEHLDYLLARCRQDWSLISGGQTFADCISKPAAKPAIKQSVMVSREQFAQELKTLARWVSQTHHESEMRVATIDSLRDVFEVCNTRVRSARRGRRKQSLYCELCWNLTEHASRLKRPVNQMQSKLTHLVNLGRSDGRERLPDHLFSIPEYGEGTQPGIHDYKISTRFCNNHVTRNNSAGRHNNKYGADIRKATEFRKTIKALPRLLTHLSIPRVNEMLIRKMAYLVVHRQKRAGLLEEWVSNIRESRTSLNTVLDNILGEYRAEAIPTELNDLMLIKVSDCIINGNDQSFFSVSIFPTTMSRNKGAKGERFIDERVATSVSSKNKRLSRPQVAAACHKNITALYQVETSAGLGSQSFNIYFPSLALWVVANPGELVLHFESICLFTMSNLWLKPFKQSTTDANKSFAPIR